MDGARTAYGEKSPMYGYSLTLQAWLRLLQGKKTEATRLAGEAERNLIEAGGTGTYYLLPLRKLKAELAARPVSDGVTNQNRPRREIQ
jgi:hypothetical protein